ncbi:hypothetical protein RB195_014251 [Necator americanus]|uniref:Uncharacterized protein n=1 Tax=Necator americanus TaxID=51031 RepID=A0ABR1DZ98_NECAM
MTVGGFLDCDSHSMLSSLSDPDDVNKVRPADIKSVGALGDSIMVRLKTDASTCFVELADARCYEYNVISKA